MKIAKRIFLVILIVVVVLGLAIGVGVYFDSKDIRALEKKNEADFKAQTGMSYKENDKAIQKQLETNEALVKDLKKFELLEHKAITDEFGARYVTGKIKNNTGSKVNYLEVDINLYDNTGTQVGNTLANIENLDVNSTWEFKAPILEKNATTYKIVNITQ